MKKRDSSSRRIMLMMSTFVTLMHSQHYYPRDRFKLKSVVSRYACLREFRHADRLKAEACHRINWHNLEKRATALH